LQIARLRERLGEGGETEVKEVIIGLGGSGDAETTALYLAKVLKNDGVRVTRFARGLPAGWR